VREEELRAKPTVTPENKMSHSGTSRTRSRESSKWPKALSPSAVVLSLGDRAGVPVDLVETRLKEFCSRYSNGVGEIDGERRQKPAFRIGCEVLRHAWSAAEEPEIQAWLAQLLVTASNSETSSAAHPAFPAIIASLNFDDTRVLSSLNTAFHSIPFLLTELERLRVFSGVESIDALSGSLSNLLRLGLLECEETGHEKSEEISRGLARQRVYRAPNGIDEARRLFLEAANDLEKVRSAVIGFVARSGAGKRLRVSVFGRQFLKVCMPGTEDKST